MCVHDHHHSSVAMVDQNQTHYFFGFYGVRSPWFPKDPAPLADITKCGEVQAATIQPAEVSGLLYVFLHHLQGGQ